MNDIIKTAGAEILENRDFLQVRTYSGYRGPTDADYKGALHLLSPDASDETLGAAVLDALALSRFALPPSYRNAPNLHPDVEFDEEFSNVKMEQHYAEWVQQMMVRYGYKSKRALFKGMRRCGVESKQGVITLRPSYHEKLEGWSGVSKDEHVVIPATSSAVEVGEAARLALSRCQ
ncbi:MAG: CdiI family contact-dependent growth inhibition immunity protein [Methylobacillus sp.]|jgi:hypothetical protein|nr:CdiI family contact-dependent growth inhibition immunity protein [Methylobacillus sp.]